MKETKERQTRICPRCGKAYSDVPSLSRADNETLICPDCGTREALASLGVGRDEQEEILETIHRNTRRYSHENAG